MFDFVSNWARERQLHRDVRRMIALADGFKNEVHAFAKRNGYEDYIDTFEMRILAAFVISETYLVARRHEQEFAEIALDRFHHISGRSFSTAFAKYHPTVYPGELADAYIEHFYTCTQARYTEYRKIVLDEHGLWRATMSQFPTLAANLVKQSAPLDSDARTHMVRMLAIGVLEHMSKCAAAFLR